MNNTANGYNTSQGWYSPQLKKLQANLLSRVFMLTSFLFLISAGIMYLVINYLYDSELMTTTEGFIVGLVSIISGWVFMYLATKVNPNRSIFKGAVYLALFTLLFSAGMGWLLGMSDYYAEGYLLDRLPIIFLLTGFATLIMSLFGYTMSNKTALNLTKFITIGCMSMIVLSLVFSMILFFAFSTKFYNWLNFVYTVFGGIISIVGIAVTVFQIKRADEFLSLDERSSSQLVANCTIAFAAMLLYSMILVVYYLARLFLRIGSK